jgi:hypothetical protein
MKHADVQKLHETGFVTDEQRLKIIEHFQLKEDGGNKFLAIVSIISAVLIAAEKIKPDKTHGCKNPLVLALALTLVGCATPPPPLKGSPDLLNFLSDGKTVRTEAITTLGQPSGRFESEKILTYRLGYEPENKGYFIVDREAGEFGWATWAHVKYSLVLVFDESGVLRTHSVVEIK